VAAEAVAVATGKPLARVLYKGGKRHGLSETWHENGVRKTAGTWKDGVMHGEYRAWDEKGQLVGRWDMKDGTGVETVYFGNGRLDHIYEYKNGERVRAVHCYANGQLNYAAGSAAERAKAGEFFAFHADGSLRQYLAKEEPGADGAERPNGPLVEWDEKGARTVSAYFAHGEAVEEREYRLLAVDDRGLPPVQERAWYEARVPAELRLEVKRYKEMAPVAVPVKDYPAN
jgi:hypothetical protein